MGDKNRVLLEEDFQKIGRVLKTFGANGQLRCQVIEEFRGLLSKGQFVWVQIDGIKVPFQIEQMQSKNKPLIIFSDVDTERKALKLANSPMFFKVGDFDEGDLITDDGMKAHYADLIGYQVQIGGMQALATVADVQIFPGQEMAFLSFGESDEPVLVPLVEEFIVKIDRTSRLLSLKLPHGMIDH